jgi:predicted membrane protein
MLWIIIVVFLVLWLLSVVGGVDGSLMRALLVIAAVALIYKLLSKRREAS